jgi:hypothetical protein
MNTDLANRVRQFVGDFCRKNPDQLQADTRLEEDLGITGDDAAEFLKAFAAAFEIDLTEIEFHKHFGPECSVPMIVWPRWLKDQASELGKHAVTVGHLVEVAAARRWSCPPQHRERKWPSPPSCDP